MYLQRSVDVWNNSSKAWSFLSFVRFVKLTVCKRWYRPASEVPTAHLARPDSSRVITENGVSWQQLRDVGNNPTARVHLTTGGRPGLGGCGSRSRDVRSRSPRSAREPRWADGRRAAREEPGPGVIIASTNRRDRHIRIRPRRRASRRASTATIDRGRERE